RTNRGSAVIQTLKHEGAAILLDGGNRDQDRLAGAVENSLIGCVQKRSKPAGERECAIEIRRRQAVFRLLARADAESHEMSAAHKRAVVLEFVAVLRVGAVRQGCATAVEGPKNLSLGRGRIGGGALCPLEKLEAGFIYKIAVDGRLADLACVERGDD